VRYLLLLFLITIGVNWPELPYNARLADVLFVALALAVCLSALRTPHTALKWRWSDLAIAGYLLGAVPAILISDDRRASAIELVRELYLVAIYVVFAIAARRGLANTIAKGLALGGAILAAAGLVVVALHVIGVAPPPLVGEVMSLPYIGATLRLRALTATPAMFACVLTAAMPFAITFCRERIRAWRAASIVMMVAALFTFSHVIAGLAVAVLMTTWPSLASWPRLRRLAVAGVAAIIVAFNFAATVSITSIAVGDTGFVDPTQYQYAVGHGEARIGGAAITYNVMSYARIKQVAWRTFAEHPIAGIGLDRFHVATLRAYTEGMLPSHYRVIDPHSTLLGRLAESGVIGGITLLLLWVAWVLMARDVVRGGDVIGVAAAAALAGLIVSSLNADIMNFRFVWVLAGTLRGLRG
jgi:hypothetical protein